VKFHPSLLPVFLLLVLVPSALSASFAVEVFVVAVGH
jgi:hypothetical protein